MAPRPSVDQCLQRPLTWVEHPEQGRDLRFSDGHGTWTRHSCPSLAAQVRRNAHRLRTAGVRPGDVVVLIGQNTPAFVTSLYGVMHLGATPAILAPAPPADLIGRLTSVVVDLAPAGLLATRDQAPLLGEVLGPLGCPVLTEAAEGDPLAPATPEPSEVALIQFSSGSTGTPRGVQVPWSALSAQLAAIYEWLDFTPESHTVSWVPFYHDMGLVGSLMMPVAVGYGGSYLPPQEFIGAPARWLAEISAYPNVSSTVPTFALGHILRRLRPADLEGLDLSGLRSLIIGAERVDPDVLEAFHRLLAPVGLRHATMLPAYGLAEATLAVTGLRADPRRIPTRRVDTDALEVGQPVAPTPDSALTTRIASCGRPVRGAGVAVLDADGTPLPEGVFGEIAVHGTSLAAGYRSKELTPFDGRHRTGDLGFVEDGELYVVGRAGDGVKTQGRWLFAEDVQQLAAQASPRPQRTAALLGTLAGRNTAVVTMEDCTAREAVTVGRFVAGRLPALRVLALLLPHGTLRRTTSGKLRRRAMWQELVASGDRSTHLVWDSAEQV